MTEYVEITWPFLPTPPIGHLWCHGAAAQIFSRTSAYIMSDNSAFTEIKHGNRLCCCRDTAQLDHDNDCCRTPKQNKTKKASLHLINAMVFFLNFSIRHNLTVWLVHLCKCMSLLYAIQKLRYKIFGGETDGGFQLGRVFKESSSIRNLKKTKITRHLFSHLYKKILFLFGGWTIPAVKELLSVWFLFFLIQIRC